MKRFGAGEMALQLRSLAARSWRGPRFNSQNLHIGPQPSVKPQFQGTQHHLPPYSNFQAHTAHKTVMETKTENLYT